MGIPFIDLAAQQAGIRGRIDAAIAEVLDSGAYVMGPKVAAFEQELAAFCGARHALSCANGTDALSYLLGDDGDGTVCASRHILVLLDLNLPDMTGVSILEKVKNNPHTRLSPVVVLTTTDD